MAKEKQNQAKKQPPTVHYPPDLDVEYTNLVRITHTPSEFVFDFARILPVTERPEVKSRIMMSPLSAKLLYRALGENLAKYESKFGDIKIPGTTNLAESLFRPPDDGE
jgi:hypothetical protein